MSKKDQKWYLSTFAYDPEFEDLAQHFGVERHDSNKGSEYQRVHSKDELIRRDIIGVKGELIVYEYYESQGIDCKLSSIIDKNSCGKTDLIVEDKTIDVKTTPFYGKELQVNQESHDNNNHSTHYMFVHFYKDGHWVDLYLVPKEEVFNWTVKNPAKDPKKGDNAYCYELERGPNL